MSFIIWYRVEIAEAQPTGGLLAAAASMIGLGLPVTVSNDVFSGSFIIDAEITITATEGASADTFEITLVNLPTATTDLINSTRASKPLQVTVSLGYFDEPATKKSPALVGRITSVKGNVGTDGLARTVIVGQEEGGFRLREAKAQASPGGSDALAFARGLVEKAGVELAAGSSLKVDLEDFTVRSDSTLAVLGRLAAMGEAPIVVRDRKVYLGDAVGADQSPVAIDPDTNLITLESTTGDDTGARASAPVTDSSDDKPPVRTAFAVTVLGHPGLRVGQAATISGLSGVPAEELRLSKVVHRFSTRGGYTTELGLVAAEAGKLAQVASGVHAAVDKVHDALERGRADHPAMDVGEVTEYAAGADKHVVTMHYGQTPDVSATAPSVVTPVDTDVDLRNKPIASPFAFHKVGLITPVYPKMRALLAHNRGLVNDAVVTGFLWPENPAQQRPQNEVGDYWLALPTQLGPDGMPAGKGANDLTDAAGNRVVQVAGLHILVGSDKLPDVGTRPDPPTDGSITIEHASGTKITVDPDGALTITSDNQKISLTNGQVSVTLDGPKVAVT